MARSVKNTNVTIKFWCLNEHISFYKKQFAEAGVADVIQISSIESCLAVEKNRPETSKLQNLLSKAKSTDIEERVTFKDGFSLFLLATQGGFFFDTNVFPISGRQVDLNSFVKEKQVMTGGNSEGKNDFYLMYSPEPDHPIMQEVLTNWLNAPGIVNLNAFDVSQKIPRQDMYKIIKSMGIQKFSYKSYYTSKKGLFSWLGTDSMIPYLRYGDIDKTYSYPLSVRTLSDFTLIDIVPWDQLEIPEDLARLSIITDIAFIYIRKKAQLFYVDKGKFPIECTLLVENYYNYLTNGSTKVVKPVQSLSPQLIQLISHPKSKIPHVANIANCTLLHHAVLTGDKDLVEALVTAGARQDIKAVYQWHLQDTHEIHEVTALELATKLGNEEFLTILRKPSVPNHIDPSSLHVQLQDVAKPTDELRAKPEEGEALLECNRDPRPTCRPKIQQKTFQLLLFPESIRSYRLDGRYSFNNCRNCHLPGNGCISCRRSSLLRSIVG